MNVRIPALLRLSDTEVAYFVQRVRSSTKTQPCEGGASRTRARLAASAFGQTLRSRKTCAAFVGGIAFMDHSDAGIRRLIQRVGLPWEHPAKRRLGMTERLLASLLAPAVVFKNWRVVRRALVADGEPVDLRFAEERFVAESGCFARFVAQVLLAKDPWRRLFVTGDVSFLRLFACFAAVRTHTPVSVLLPHRRGHSNQIPITVEHLFTMDSEAAKNFNPPPLRTVVEPVEARKRQIRTAERLAIGIATDNFVDVEEVWAAARECAAHRVVAAVRVRLHPGSNIDRLPEHMPSSVVLDDSNESLGAFAEQVDLAIVSRSSAVPRLQELLVPCFHLRSLYAENDRSNRRDPSQEVVWNYPTPEIVDSLSDFLDGLTVGGLNQMVESLEQMTAGIRSPTAAALELVRAELEGFLLVRPQD